MRYDILERIKATNKPFKIQTDYVEDEALIQFAECMEQPSVIQGFLAPDTHAGYVAPIGSVLASKGTIFPSFVGYDIGCGMSSITISNITNNIITKEKLKKIKEDILKEIPIGFSKHKKEQPGPYPDVPHTIFAEEVLKTIGKYQLGTLGGGNHFIEIGTTNKGTLCIIIHSGSRNVGHKIATHYMKEAAIQNTDENRYKKEFDEKNKDWKSKILTSKPSKNNDTLQNRYDEAKKEFVYRRVRARVSNIEDGYPLDVTSDIGKDYIKDMNFALEYALYNRKVMLDKIVDIIQKVYKEVPLKTERFINKNHNHAEYKNGIWIHRKGATQADKDMLGVIPGNMKDGSFIVKGLGNKESMYSSSHGAGRVLSRRKAKEQLDLQEFIDETSHLISNHSDSNLDEAPKAYKNIFEVMENQKDLVEVLDYITPILNIKG